MPKRKNTDGTDSTDIEYLSADFSVSRKAHLDEEALFRYERLVEIVRQLDASKEVQVDNPKKRESVHCITLKTGNPFYVKCDTKQMDLFREALSLAESFECYAHPNHIELQVTFSVVLYREK